MDKFSQIQKPNKYLLKEFCSEMKGANVKEHFQKSQFCLTGMLML